MICLDQISIGRTLSCGHIFHGCCIDALKKTTCNPLCPLCRRKLQIQKQKVPWYGLTVGLGDKIALRMQELNERMAQSSQNEDTRQKRARR